MAKTTNPLLSIEAHGRLGHETIYGGRKRKKFARSYAYPRVPLTSAQLAQRAAFREALTATREEWKDPAKREAWRTKRDAARSRLSPWAYAMQQNLLVPPLDPSLVLWLKFDNQTECENGDYQDSTLYDNDGTQPAPTERPTWTSDGLDFDGTDDAVDIADSATIRFADTDFGISFWLNRDISGSLRNMVGTETNVGAYKGWSIRMQSTNEVFFGVYETEAKHVLSSFTSVDTWHHVVAVVSSGNSINIYLDDVPSTPTVITETDFEKNIGLQIGNIENDSKRWFDGTIDDVRVYNRTLTPGEIHTLYSQGH